MAESPSSSSTQNSVNIALESQSANTIIHVEDESGKEIITFAPTKTYQSVVISTKDLVNGNYKVYFGGSYEGDVKDGLYSNGKYISESEATEFSISDTVTSVGNTGFNRGGGKRF
jgi:hypothetical protein